MKLDNLNSCDAINFRSYLVDSEIIHIMTDNGMNKSKNNPRAKVPQNKVNQLKELVNRVGRKIAIENIAQKGKKFDILYGLCVKCDYYSYMDKVPTWGEYNQGKKTDFLTNMADFYNKILNMYKQLFQGASDIATGLIDTDKSIEDSDGKESSLLGTFAAVETKAELVPLSDSAVSYHYKIFLEFLYTVSTSLKPSKNDSYDEIIPSVLAYLWFKDTIYSENSRENSASHYRYFPVYESTVGNRILSESDIHNRVTKITTKKYVPPCIKDAIKKTYYKYTDDIEDTEISTNIYVFARYIYKLLMLCGVDIFKAHNKTLEKGTNYKDADIYETIFNPDNVNSLVHNVPAYKFLPKFYEKTNTLQEWFTKNEQDINNEYGIADYKGFTTSEPIKQLINSKNTSKILASRSLIDDSGYKHLSGYDKKEELNQILMLTHYHKLLGLSPTPNLLFKQICDAKLKRVSLLEGPAHISYISKNNSDIFVSIDYEETVSNEIQEGDLHPMYKILGNSGTTGNWASFSTNIEILNDEPSQEARDILKQMLEHRVRRQVQFYQNKYRELNWNIPYRYNSEELYNVIMSSEHIEPNTKYVQLLGDLVTFDVAVTVAGLDVKDYEMKKFALRGDYRLVEGNNAYTPEVIINEKTGKKELVVILDQQSIEESKYRL